MQVFPTLSRRPSSCAIGLVPRARRSTSPTGGTVTQPLSAMSWGLTFTYDELPEPDAAVLDAFLLSTAAHGWRFVLPAPLDFFAEITNKYPETLGKLDLAVQLGQGGFSMHHLPGGGASFTIDVIEIKE